MRRVILSVWLLAVSASLAHAAGADSPSQLFEHGAYRRTAALCETRIAANANDAEALTWLARVRTAEGHFDDAQKLAERAVKAAPNDADAHYALGEACGAKAQDAGPLTQFGLARRLKKEAEAALALDPKHEDAQAILVQFHLRAPGVIGGDKKTAATLLAALTAEDPARGLVLEAQQCRGADTTRIDGLLERALTAAPRSARPRIELAQRLTRPYAANFARAEALAREATQLEPWRASGWALLAGILAHVGRFADMDAVLAQAEVALPDNLMPVYVAARTLVSEKREPARAEKLLRRYLERTPEIGAAPLSGAHWRLALALEQQGRRDDAVAELQTALKITPDFPDAKRDLKRLKG